MTTPRCILAAGLATALAWTLGLVTAPMSRAYTETGVIHIWVLSDGVLAAKANETLRPLAASEEFIIDADRRVGRVTFSMFNDAGEPSGVLAEGNSLAKDYCSISPTIATCYYPSTLNQVRVDFGAVTVNTTVAMTGSSDVPLAFNGGSGRDYVQGGAADDWIRGNGGDDQLFGWLGDDYLDGGPGNDSVEGEEGRDDMRGGPGRDSIEAEDGIQDILVDCGGPPAYLNVDFGLDEPTNCSANPTPIPPAPIEPVDPPAPGQGNGSVDGAPVNVVVEPEREDTRRCSDNYCTSVRVDKNNILTGLPFVEQPGSDPFTAFPTLLPAFSMYMPNLSANSYLDASIWPIGGVSNSSLSVMRATPRSQPISMTAIRVNAQGVAEGDVPVPAGQQPGNFTLQVNAVLASGAAVTVNIGVALTQATPDPDPGPTQTIAIAKATRGKGKKAATITVTGTTTGLAGTSVTPRYRVQGAKKWTLGTPVTVAANGSFTGTVVTPKKVRIMVVSGAIKSQAVQVAAVRR